MRFEPQTFLAELPKPATPKWPDGVPFVEAFSKHNFVLEFFAPGKKDYQTPHDRDEFYFISAGTADFVSAGKTEACKSGDAIFVPAGEEHHFEAMSDDFSTWVLFV